MAGKIKAKSPFECPKCKAKWIDTGDNLICPKCLTKPDRFYIYLGFKGEKLRLFSLGEGKPFRTYFHARRVLDKIRTEIDEKKFDPSNYTKKKLQGYNFERFIRERWLVSKERDIKKGQFSEENYIRVKGQLERIIIPHFEKSDIRDIKSGQVQELYDFLPPDYSPKTIKNVMGTLHKILTDAKKWGYISDVPEFPSIRVPETPPKWIGIETQELILNKLQQKYPQHYNPIFFMMLQGTRPGETRALCWDCVDFQNEQILIKRSYDGSRLKEYPKNKVAEPIPMHPEIREMLLSTPRQDIGKYKNCVFLCHGKPYGQNRLNVIWRKVCDDLGIENINCYQGTRHSLASQAANRGVSEAIIGKMLRHRDPKSTKQYAHYRTNALRLIWEKKRVVRKIAEQTER